MDDVKKLPSNLLGRMSTREIEDLITEKKTKTKAEDDGEQIAKNVPEAHDDLDEGELLWDTELESHKKEKSRAFSILSQFVPQSEIFFNLHTASRSLIKQKEELQQATDASNKPSVTK